MTSDVPPAYRQAIVEMVCETLKGGRQPVTFTVRGDSMAPTLNDGDQVRITPADPGKLQPGELVVYVDAGGQIIAHRVVRVEGAIVNTKGDNRDQDDPPVPLTQVLGKVQT